MADVTNAPVPPPDSGAPAAALKGGAGFMATTMGKIVVGGLALLVLVGIAGAIVFVFASGAITGLLSSGGVTTVTTVTSPVDTPAPVDAAPIVNPQEKPLQSTFTFRNVFAPSIKPAVEPSESVAAVVTPAETAVSAEVTSPTVAPATVLTLTEIVAEGDVHKGVFTWNGTSYTAGNGETIDSSPWKVLEVNLDSALMLYGDAQVTIAVGESISK